MILKSAKWLALIIPQMSSSPNSWTDRSVLRLDLREPYLCVHDIIVFVRDQDRSLRFYVDQLGFRLVVDHRFESGERWIEVAPPDGSANLALVAPKPDSPAHKLIGGDRWIFFLTEDVYAKYKEWSDRGVRFLFPPEQPAWGDVFTRFEDLDGNSFGLAGFDEVRRSLEVRRRAHLERLEAERRATQELEIAKQVQSRLFPQVHPELKTVEYAGLCLPAREVGGDYFDFLNLGHERLGFIIGDVSGKGIAAALLMANLQANLRSQCAVAVDHPEILLRSVNRLFYENTGDSAYASLFFAEYEDATRRLRYVNCGHLSGLLLRRDNSLERLDSTGTLLGLFQQWDCSMRECEVFPGDVLALFTDGVTEACNKAGEEFGEENLIAGLREHRRHFGRGSWVWVAGTARRHHADHRQVPNLRIALKAIGYGSPQGFRTLSLRPAVLLPRSQQDLVGCGTILCPDFPFRLGFRQLVAIPRALNLYFRKEVVTAVLVEDQGALGGRLLGFDQDRHRQHSHRGVRVSNLDYLRIHARRLHGPFARRNHFVPQDKLKRHLRHQFLAAGQLSSCQEWKHRHCQNQHPRCVFHISPPKRFFVPGEAFGIMQRNE